MWMALAVVVATAGCKRKAPAPAPEPGEARGAPLPATEITLGHDACTSYVTQACGCAATVPGVGEECKLARALPEAVRVSSELAASEQATKLDSAQALDMLRKTTATCISKTAALPTQGCTAPARSGSSGAP